MIGHFQTKEKVIKARQKAEQKLILIQNKLL
jgi:hypothetical protein